MEELKAEVSLKEAVKLCGKSEKTLRRKIDAGLLNGRREPMEYGGFMWVIELESLESMFPGSVPEGFEIPVATEPPPTRLGTPPGIGAEETALQEVDDDDDEVPMSVAHQMFFDYLLDENKCLKEDIRRRDGRIAELQEKALILERTLGEQEGTSTTQAKVLEWFQQQEAQRALPPGPEEIKPVEAKSLDMKTVVLTLLSATGLFLVLMVVTGQLRFLG